MKQGHRTRPGAPRALHAPGTHSLVATATPGTRLPRPVTPSRAPVAPRLQLRCDADDWLSARVSLSSLHPWSQWRAPPGFVDSSHTLPGRATDQSLHREGGAETGRTNDGQRDRPRPPRSAPGPGEVARRPLHLPGTAPRPQSVADAR